MSAWEEAEVRSLIESAIRNSISLDPYGHDYHEGVPDAARLALAALAPHLAARDAATWAQACEAAAKLLEMHASLVSVQNVDEPVHAAILEAADNYMRETADVIRNLTPPQPQSEGTE